MPKLREALKTDRRTVLGLVSAAILGTLLGSSSALAAPWQQRDLLYDEYAQYDGGGKRTALYYENFEGNNAESYYRVGKVSNETISEVVQNPSGPGKVLKSRVFYGWELIGNGARSEVSLGRFTRDNIKLNQDYTYALRVFMPEKGSDDYGNIDDRGTIVQFHPFEAGPGPVYFIRANTNSFLLGIRRTSGVEPGRKATKHTIPSQPGKWMSFVFHIRWSTKSDGLMRLYSNGELIKESRGPNAALGAPSYMKYGIYHSGGWNFAAGKDGNKKPLNRNKFAMMYHDEVKISEGFH